VLLGGGKDEQSDERRVRKSENSCSFKPSSVSSSTVTIIYSFLAKADHPTLQMCAKLYAERTVLVPTTKHLHRTVDLNCLREPVGRG
jgi:hypothetical protein